MSNLNQNTERIHSLIEKINKLPAAAQKVLLQEKTVTPAAEVQEVIPDEGYTGLSKVTVEAVELSTDIPSGVVRNDVANILVDTHGVGGNFECQYGKKLSLTDGTLSVDEVLTASSALSLDTLTSALKGNYLIRGSDIYYIPTDAVFTQSSSTENYVTTYTLTVDKAGKMEVADAGNTVPSSEGVEF